MRVLVTGGLGYIGAHVCVALRRAGWHVFIVDNLSGCAPSALAEVRALGGDDIEFAQADLRDAGALGAALGDRRFDAVVHLASAKSVPRSLLQPQYFQDNNVAASANLLREMQRRGIRKLVFSSTAAVYGPPLRLPLDEGHPLAPQNPYGRTKADVEQMIRDAGRANPEFRFAILRYFNAAGAEPRDASPNLMPAMVRVAAGDVPALEVFGSDYETADGTCVRDYVHVLDLVEGHLAALRYLESSGSITANLGCGRGFSVKEMVAAFERANGVPVPLRLAARRAGDVAASYADVSLARRALGWEPKRDLEQICTDSWRSRPNAD
jgi:UDP-glucose 4-epimerase